MADLVVENLRKEFGKLVAVNDISFEFEENEFVTLVGPSGSGKTTIIRMIAGLESPTSGRILLDNEEITDKLPQERDVAMLFQDVALYPHMSVRENIGYGLKIAGVSKDDRNEAIEGVAELLQIPDQLDKKPSELSGGQQQRAALGRSMIRRPSVFLFDEAMSDLDAKLKRELRPVVEEAVGTINCPTIYVTHDQEEAMTMSDKIIVLNQGNIAQVGTPEEIYNNPTSKFVGQFIGSPEMQFFDGNVRQQNGDTLIECAGVELTVSTQVDSNMDKVTIGIRPQDISVSQKMNGNGIEVTHVMDEPLGDRIICHFDGPSGRVQAIQQPGFQGNRGNYVISFDLSDGYLFSQETGERIL